MVMGKSSTILLRVVLALVFIGALAIQGQAAWWLYLASSADTADVSYVHRSTGLYVVLALLIIQVCCICVWKLAARVQHGTVFSPASYKFVNIIIAAISFGSIMTFALGAIMAPGPEVAPGVVLLAGGLGVVLAGISLIVWVLRQLLAQASHTEAQAADLRTELNGVI